MFFEHTTKNILMTLLLYAVLLANAWVDTKATQKTKGMREKKASCFRQVFMCVVYFSSQHKLLSAHL